MADTTRSGTEVVMEAMEQFGQCEPRQVIVIYVDENHDIVTVTNCRRVEAMGLLECCKDIVLKMERQSN